MIDEVIFPTDISQGSRGGPRYSTTIVKSASGAEQRIQNWDRPLGRWNVAHGVKNRNQLSELLSFFHCRGGMARGFLFVDPLDHRLDDEQIGVGNGTRREFQIQKSYSDGSRTTIRSISRTSSAGLVVKVGNSTVTGWSMNSTTGVLTLSSAPPVGSAIRVTGEFAIPARFASDAMNVTLEGVIGGWDEIVIEEILGP